MEGRLFRHGVVDSTSERAFAALAEGSARHGDAHAAEGQTAGRGRLGRRWESPAGEGLYLSLVLLPDAPPRPAALTMAAGLGTLEAAQALGARTARLKWPNDVLADGAKLAGILVEARGLDPARPHAVVGVGLNVGQRAFPTALTEERPVTSLALLGLDVSREHALETLLGHLRARLDEACARPADVAADYAAACGLLGREVVVRRGQRELRGVLTGLDLDGLALRGPGGDERVPLEHALAVEAVAETRYSSPP